MIIQGLILEILVSIIWITTLCVTISFWLGEWKHPLMNKKIYIQEYCQTILISSTSTFLIWIYEKFFPDTFQDNIGENSWIYLIISTIVFALIYDCINYWAHRLLHTSWFYKNIHALHHQYKPVTTMTSIAIHFFEIPIIVLPPNLMAAFLLKKYGYGINRICSYLVLNINLIQSIYFHSMINHRIAYGPLIDNQDHLIHHKTHKYNYGNFFRYWDWICGTYNENNNLLI